MDTRDAVLRDYLAKLIVVGPPVAIVLFGSQATGQAGPDSDFDFCVIEHDLAMEVNPPARRDRYWRALRPRTAPVDLLVYAQSEFARAYHDGWSVPQEIVQKGIWLYGSPRSVGIA